MIHTEKEKVRDQAIEHFLRVGFLDKKITFVVISTLYGILSAIVQIILPNLNTLMIFFIIFSSFCVCVNSALYYLTDKISGYFRKAKAQEEHVNRLNKEQVIFEGSLDELTSDLYEFGFRLSERIGEYYAFKIKHLILPNKNLLVKEVDGICRIYYTRFDKDFRLKEYLNLKSSDNYKYTE